MSSRPGYKITEIGEIPEEWEAVALGEHIEIRNSKAIAGVPRIAVIPMELIPTDGIYARFRLADARDVRSSVYCEPGDILLAKITPSVENGKQGIVPEVPSRVARATTEVYPIRCRPNLIRLFLFYLLKDTRFRNVLVNRMTGSTGRQRIPKEAVLDLTVPLPPLSEQGKIASILSTVDDAIQKTDEIIAKAQQLERGLMQQLLTKGIGHTKFKQTEIGEIPEEWGVLEVGKIADIRGGKRIPKGDRLVEFKTPHPYVRVIDFRDGSVDVASVKYMLPETYEKIKKYTISSEDIYISIAGTIGMVGSVPKELDGANLTENAAKLCGLRNVEKVFLVQALSSPSSQHQIRSLIGRATQQKLALFRIARVKISVPPLPEQGKIASILSAVDAKIENEKVRKQTLEKLKMGLMQVLLTGRVRVRLN